VEPGYIGNKDRVGVFSTKVEGTKKYCVIEGLRNYDGVQQKYTRIYKHEGDCEEKIISGEDIRGSFYAYDSPKPGGYYKFCVFQNKNEDQDRRMKIEQKVSGVCSGDTFETDFYAKTPYLW
jgi:hypothetical protein